MDEKDTSRLCSPQGVEVCPERTVSQFFVCIGLSLALALGLCAETTLLAQPGDVVVNEILYHPDPDNTGGEFVELFNRGDSAVDLSGWMLVQAVTFVFPKGTTIEPGGYVVVARDPEAASTFYDLEVLGPYEGRLNNAGESFVLQDAGEQEIDSVPYDDSEPWPAEADGGGPSLELVDPSEDNSLAESWAIGDPYSPGFHNAPVVPGGGEIVITEIMYKPRRTERREKFDNVNKGTYIEEGGDKYGEYIELYNRSDEAVDLSGWVFSEGIDYTFTDGTILSPDSYLVVAGDAEILRGRLGIDNLVGPFDLSLRDGGERVTLRDNDGRLVDSVRYNDKPPWPTAPDEFGVSLECIAPLEDNGTARNWRSAQNRFPPVELQTPEFVEAPADGWERYEVDLVARTTRFALFLEEPGEWLIDSLVFRPIRGGDDVVENGTFDENDDGWKKRGNHSGSHQTFDEAKEGPGSERLVAVGDGSVSNSISIVIRGIPVPELYRATFWAKRISGSRELTILLLGVGHKTVRPPDARRSLAAEWSSTANPNGQWAYRDGEGVLLRERTGNWLAADLGPEQPAWVHRDTETPGWCRSVGGSSTHDFPAGRIGAYGPAQVVWKSPAVGRVRITGGVYLVHHNGGDQVWELRFGNDVISTGELIAGVTEINSGSPSLFGSGTGGVEALERDVRRRETIVLDIRAKPGQESGLVGVDLSIAFVESVPPAPPVSGAVGLGSPGGENAVVRDATPPLVEELEHFPAQPTSKDPVTVTALVTSVNAEIGKVELGYERLFGTGRSTLEPVQMFDDGVHNDGEAGDGVYGATLEPQRSQTFMHYWVIAEDGDGRSTQFPYPSDPESTQGYFHFDNDIRTEVSTYHLYMTRENQLKLTRDPRNNDYLDCSLVINDRRPGKEQGPIAYPHIGGRRRGRSSRFHDRHQWKFKFNRIQLYDGNRVIDTMLRLPLLQRIGFATFDFAGITSLESDLVRLYLNGRHWETYIAFESPNPTWASKHGYGGGAEAYKARTVETDSKNSDLYHNQIVTDLDYWGVWNKKMDPLEPPHSIRALTGALNDLSDDTLLPWLNDHVDVEQIMMRYGINILLNIDDFPTHNYYVFRPEDGKWTTLGYDYDSLGRGGVLTFDYGDGSTGTGSQRNKIFNRIHQSATLTRMHALTLRRLMATLTARSLGAVYAKEMARARRERGIRGDADQHAINQLRSQTARMRRAVLANRPPENDAVPVIDPPGGVDFTGPVTATLSVLEGWLAVYTLDGGDPRLSASATVYTDPIVVNQPMTVRAAAIRARNGEPMFRRGDWTDLAQADYSFSVDVRPVFLRGDVSLDGNVNTTDIVQLLRYLFKGGESGCRAAGDANNDNTLDISDAIYLVDFLFRRGTQPAEPFPRAGHDQDGVESLGCQQSVGF